jgi:hypothetical protein
VATEQQHVDRARANEAFAAPMSTVESTAAAWKVTVNFYAALHYVEAIIIRGGGTSMNHDARSMAIAKIPALRPIRNDYKILSSSAREARYDPTTDFGARNDTQMICDLAHQIGVTLGF